MENLCTFSVFLFFVTLASTQITFPDSQNVQISTLARSIPEDNVNDNLPKDPIKPPETIGTVISLNSGTNATDNPDGSESPDKNAFLEWLAGIAGLSTTQPPPVLFAPTKCDPCECGITNKKNRIVGGQETQVNQYPWMALLLYGTRFYCGASLINDRYVITAAHCVNGFDVQKIKVRFLEHDKDSTEPSQAFNKKAQRLVIHRGYSNSNYNNDIALIRLDSPVTFNNNLRPVCLPTAGRSFSGLMGIVTGWGATEEHGEVSSTLQEVEVPILSNKECRETPYGKRISDNMLCAGYKQGMKDSCQGDSGGPLHIVNDTLHHIVGVVSWGDGCAQAKYPGVYSRVNRYKSWIKSNTKDACYCSTL